MRIFIQDIPFKNNIYIYARKKVPVFRRYLVQKDQKKVKKDKEEGKVKNSIIIPEGKSVQYDPETPNRFFRAKLDLSHRLRRF